VAINYSFPATGCTATAAVTVNALPALFIASATAGSYCAGSASTIHVNLSGSATGFSYQLQLGGSNLGSAISGTGGALDFGVQGTTGAYTVIATNNATGCSRLMAGSPAISVTPLPTVFTLSADGDG